MQKEAGHCRLDKATWEAQVQFQASHKQGECSGAGLWSWPTGRWEQKDHGMQQDETL